MARVRNVFISSSHTNLRKERRAIRDVSEQLGTFVLRIEARGATAKAPLEWSLAMVRQSDALVILVGPDEGSRPPGMTTTFSELEYEEAVKRQIPTFVFFSDDSPLASGPKGYGPRKELIKRSSLDQLAREVTDILVDVAHDSEDAKMIARRAGFPRAHIPEFKKPLGFWNNMVEQSIRGRSGLGALVGEAARQFPYNPDLGRLHERITKQFSAPIGPPTRNLVRRRLSAWHKRLLRERVCESFSGAKDLRVKVAVALARWMLSIVPWYHRPFILFTTLVIAAPGWINLGTTWWLSAKGATMAAAVTGASVSLVLWNESDSTESRTANTPDPSTAAVDSVEAEQASSRTHRRRNHDDGSDQGSSGSYTTGDSTGGEETGRLEESGGSANEPAQLVAQLQEIEEDGTRRRRTDMAAQLALLSNPVGIPLDKQAKIAIWRIACEVDTYFEHESVHGFTELAGSIADDDALEKGVEDGSYYAFEPILTEFSGIRVARPGYTNFTHWDSRIPAWIAQNLLPSRREPLCNKVSAEMLYERAVLPFMRGAAAVLIFHAEKKPKYPREASYSWPECDTGICTAFSMSEEEGKGDEYYKRGTRFLGSEDGEYSKWGFTRDDVALDQWNHFWIRRCIDGTMNEFAYLLSMVIHRYDSKFEELYGPRLREATKEIAESPCAHDPSSEPLSPAPLQTISSGKL